jgi:predicted nucleotidyltransferase
MRVCGIVCEYNPFHNGHKYQLDRIKEAGFDAVVAVMSGNFVQRGEPAITEKHKRAEAALLNGVDLIIELPLPYSVASAQRFALGSVDILNSLGQVDSLCFGSECGNIELLETLALTDFDDEIKYYISDGMSYPCAYEAAVEKKLGQKYSSALQGSNNLLGIEYIKALNQLSCNIKPMTIMRTGTGHDSVDESGVFTSANNIRNNLLSEDIARFMPDSSYSIIMKSVNEGFAPASLNNCERSVLAVLRKLDKDYFSTLPDISEGLDNRLYSAVRNATSLEQLYNEVKTRRYTMARVKRLVLCAYLGIDSSFYEFLSPYIRVLGMNNKGRQILRQAKETAAKPVYMLSSDFANADPISQKLFSLEAKSTDLYSLCTKAISPCAAEYLTNPVIMVD